MNAPLRRLAAVIAVLFASLLASSTWIQYMDAGKLNAKSTNTRTLFKEFGRDRGPILVNGAPIAQSVPSDDVYKYLRTYPGGQAYSQLTGYFSVIFGTSGLEQAEGSYLSGTADQLFYRRISDLLTGRQPKGASVELTIQPKAQAAAWRGLGKQRGAVVALDPKTGAILAMVSRPSFDANQLASHDAAKVRAARKALLADPDKPLNNRAIGGDLYPPGSTFKIITSAAALSSGRYTQQSMIDAPDVLDLPQTSADLQNFGGERCSSTGKMTIADALRISCNTAFGALGMALGDQALREQAQKFGFGQDLSIPLTVTPSQFPAELNQPQTAQSAIGQFDVRVTPLQMAMVSAAIANDGTLMRPEIVRAVRSSEVKVISQLTPQKLSEAVTPDVAEQLTSMMEGVVESGTGTRAQIDGVKVAGKTGTAQHGEGEAPHAWFTAFAPADDPQVAVAVVVEDGGQLGDEASGGRVAAPIARQVMEAVLGT